MVGDLFAGRHGEGASIAEVELLWIPLGAGQRVVRASGKAFETASAMLQRRGPCDLYHSALTVTVDEGRFVIEMTPIPRGDRRLRGVVAEGAVGTRWVRRLRVFRYEIRRWCNGVIPDESEASARVRLGVDRAAAQRLLDVVPSVPTPVWGRDELHTGEMWNSNSVTSWLLATSGFDTGEITPPVGGRAPGWSAGLVVAARRVPEVAPASPGR